MTIREQIESLHKRLNDECSELLDRGQSLSLAELAWRARNIRIEATKLEKYLKENV